MDKFIAVCVGILDNITPLTGTLTISCIGNLSQPI